MPRNIQAHAQGESEDGKEEGRRKSKRARMRLSNKQNLNPVVRKKEVKDKHGKPKNPMGPSWN